MRRRPRLATFRVQHDDDLEGALALIAYIVLRHGDAYAPLLFRLEREMEDVRRRQSHQERARQILKMTRSQNQRGMEDDLRR